jgi:hypothetical protein
MAGPHHGKERQGSMVSLSIFKPANVSIAPIDKLKPDRVNV